MKDPKHVQTDIALVVGDLVVRTAEARRLIDAALARPPAGLVDDLLRAALLALDARLVRDQRLGTELSTYVGDRTRMSCGFWRLGQIAASGARPLTVSEYRKLEKEVE